MTQSSLPAKAPDPTITQPQAKSKHRSPAYPFVSLKKAVDRAKAIYDIEKRYAVALEIVAKHWGFKPKSSGLLQTVAALRQFGLLAPDEGLGLDRKIRLSERAIRILIDQREDERRKAVQEAALSPKLYAKLWSMWGDDLPSDGNAVSMLVFEMEFNPDAASAVLKGYKETLSFAGNLSGVSVPDQGESEPKVDDEDSENGATDSTGSATESRVATNAGAGAKPAAPIQLGEEEYLRARLAGGRVVRVMFQGAPPTQLEIAKLIAMLELSKDQYPTE